MRPLASAMAVALVAVAAGCGDEPSTLTVEQVIELPVAPGEPVRVHGTGIPVSERAFVVAGEQRSIFVVATPERTDRVQAGRPVTVDGVVKRVGDRLARDLAAVVEGNRVERLDRRLVPLLRRARRAPGSLYIDPRPGGAG